VASGAVPDRYSGVKRITVGRGDDERRPMQVVSGPIGKERCTSRLPRRSDCGGDDAVPCVVQCGTTIDAVLKAGVAISVCDDPSV